MKEEREEVHWKWKIQNFSKSVSKYEKTGKGMAR